MNTTPKLAYAEKIGAINYDNVSSVELLDHGDIDTSSNRVLLAPVKKEEREGFLRASNLISLQENYLTWVKNNVFIGVDIDIHNIKTGFRENKLKFMLAPKRGNDKYANMLTARMKGFNNTIPDKDLFDTRNKRKTCYTPMFKITGTYDPKHCSRYSAWDNVGHELNRLRSNLIKYFKCPVSIIHTWENFKKKKSPAYGYPHFNLIVMLGNNKKVSTFNYKGEWRLSCKRDLEKYWHSHMDIKAVSRIGMWDEEDQPENNDSYISLAHNLKYITKDLRESKAGSDYVLLNAILWCMRKRAFSFNGDFLKRFEEICVRLESVEANSNFPELKMSENPDIEVTIRLLGVFPGCIFKCIKRLRGKVPENCPYLRFANQLELRENWCISKFNCGSSMLENENVEVSFTDAGLNYHLYEGEVDPLTSKKEHEKAAAQGKEEDDAIIKQFLIGEGIQTGDPYEETK